MDTARVQHGLVGDYIWLNMMRFKVFVDRVVGYIFCGSKLRLKLQLRILINLNADSG